MLDTALFDIAVVAIGKRTSTALGDGRRNRFRVGGPGFFFVGGKQFGDHFFQRSFLHADVFDIVFGQ